MSEEPEEQPRESFSSGVVGPTLKDYEPTTQVASPAAFEELTYGDGSDRGVPLDESNAPVKFSGPYGDRFGDTPVPATQGRFIVKGGDTPEGETGTYVTISEGFVYEQNITAKTDEEPPEPKPTKLHTPKVEGEDINSVPPPVLKVEDGQTVYLSITTDPKGLVEGVAIVAAASDQVSTHHEPPTLETPAGVSGDYYFELATISVSDGEITPTQKFASDFIWRPTSIHRASDGGGVGMVEKYDKGEWHHKRVMGIKTDEPPITWNETLDALTDGDVGITATDGTTSANLETSGVWMEMQFREVSLAGYTENIGKVTVVSGLWAKFEGQSSASGGEFIDIPEVHSHSGENYSVAPTWNENLTPGSCGVTVDDGAGNATIGTEGASGIIKWTPTDGTSTPVAELHIKNGLIYKIVTPTNGVVEYCPECTFAP